MRSIVKAAVRITLLYLFLTSLFNLFGYISTIATDISRSRIPSEYIFPYYVVPIIVSVICILILCILWWKTDWLVRFLVGDAPDDSVVISTSNLNLFVVALRIIGIFLIVTAVPNFVGHISFYISLNEMSPDFLTSNTMGNWIRELAISIATLIIGLVLAFSGTKLFNPLHNLWSTGSLSGKKPDSDDS